jgi:5-(carboxyamino)imidazole ribonucleotide mutase
LIGLPSQRIFLSSNRGERLRNTDVLNTKPFSDHDMKKQSGATVGILMGSDTDWPVMKAAADACAEFDVPHEVQVISAHRTPQDLTRYATGAHKRGLMVIIAGAGGAAHLPGVTAALTPLPVIGVPIESKALHGLDSLLSIVQMPSGIPVATVAIGGGRNAGLLAVKILAVGNPTLQKKVLEFKARLAEESRAKNRNLARMNG